MDPAEIRFIRWVVIKEWGAEIWKNPPIPHAMRGLLSYSAISCRCWLFGNKLPTAHTASAAFYSLHTSVGNGAMNKFGICFQWRHEHFKPRMLLFSVGNDAMNALQILATAQRVSRRHWLGCNIVCSGFTNCKWKMTIEMFYWRSLFLSTFPAFLTVFLLSVLHLCILSCTVQYSLPLQGEEGRGEEGRTRGSTTRLRNLCSAFEQANTVPPIPTAPWMSFPRWQFASELSTAYEVALYL